MLLTKKQICKLVKQNFYFMVEFLTHKQIIFSKIFFKLMIKILNYYLILCLESHVIYLSHLRIRNHVKFNMNL